MNHFFAWVTWVTSPLVGALEKSLPYLAPKGVDFVASRVLNFTWHQKVQPSWHHGCSFRFTWHQKVWTSWHHNFLPEIRPFVRWFILNFLTSAIATSPFILNFSMNHFFAWVTWVTSPLVGALEKSLPYLAPKGVDFVASRVLNFTWHQKVQPSWHHGCSFRFTWHQKVWPSWHHNFLPETASGGGDLVASQVLRSMHTENRYSELDNRMKN